MNKKIEVKRENGGVSQVVVGDVNELLPAFISNEKRVIFITDEEVTGVQTCALPISTTI